ncbi:hypothetical protein, partial [Bradyrhizobium canariense]|uniref:hypothetical protein n=2 Tax=Bradyrhizobium TaxID=374 RepID=UPI001CA58C7E
KQSSGEISREAAKLCLQFKNASWKRRVTASYSVIASAAKQSRNASVENVWIASSQELLAMTTWRQFRLIALGFPHHRPAGADIAPLE